MCMMHTMLRELKIIYLCWRPREIYKRLFRAKRTNIARVSGRKRVSKKENLLPVTNVVPFVVKAPRINACLVIN